jgi:hypothetical protein
MVEPLLNVKAVCELFGFKDARTARKIMREMEHIENPLLVSERAVKAWIAKRTLPPESETRRILKRKGA